MTGVFDVRKALREELEGLSGVLTTLRVQERRAQEKMAEAESEYNAAVKLRGFCQAEMERKRAVLRAEEEKFK
jgi:hypothetical protein